jgi:hypothetical protein
MKSALPRILTISGGCCRPVGNDGGRLLLRLAPQY